MEERDEEQRLIRRYLLGEPGAEREQVEEQMLADPEYFERVLMVEEELFDDFVFGDMSATERENFTQHLLASPRQIKKLDIATALKNFSRKKRRPGLWWLASLTAEHRLGAALALAALLLLGSFVGYRMFARDPLEKELARLNSRPAIQTQPAPSDYAVPLTPTLFRGPGVSDDEKQVTIPPGAEVVLLHLSLAGEDYESYKVSLKLGAEARQFDVEGLTAAFVDGAKVLPFRVPARALTAGRHELMLSGVAKDGSIDQNVRRYIFRIVGDNR